MRVSDLTVEPEPEPEPERDGGQVNGTAEIVSTSRIHWESLLRALDSVHILRLHGGDRLAGLRLGKGIEISSSILHTIVSASDSETLLPHLQRLYIAQCDVRCAQRDDGVVFWNLPRFALPGHAGGLVARDGEVGRGVGNELVAVVRRRVGLEVVLVGCGLDEEVLDELRKDGQVRVGDEWVYV
jgi:hypothetical protein